MTEEDGVAPETQTETETESNLLSIGDIAEAAGVESLFESVESKEPEGEEVEEEVTEEVAETVPEPEPEPQESDGVKKRIGKLIEAREEAKAEAEELRRQLAEAKKEKPEPKPPEQKGLSRFDDVTTLEELQNREAHSEHLREWLLANPDGGEYKDADGDEYDVDYDQAKNLIVETDRDLRKNFPIVRQRLFEAQKQNNIALQTFKWMSDRASPESLELQNILSQNQFLNSYSKKDPHAKIVLGYAVEGFKAIQAQKLMQQQGQGSLNAAPQVPVAPSRAKPSVVKGKSDKGKTLLDLARSGEVDDAAKYIESLL